MHSPLGTTACLPLFSHITKIWSDVWVIDELVVVGWVWGKVSVKSGEQGS